MNAATRAVVRTAIAAGYSVAGIRDGFTGLIAGDLRWLGPRDVGGIIHLGGTMLGSTRCEALRTECGRSEALDTIKKHDIEALIVIGGNGSQTGAFELSKLGVRVVGVASTIDNDLFGSDVTIGATTAVDVALESIDRLRTTASSMRRAFLVEVMGRHCGYLALMAGIAGGAEAIVVPEAQTSPEQVTTALREAYARGKSHAIAVVAEGAAHNAEALGDYAALHAQRLGFDLRVTKLGHVQRGGAPGAFDRMLGTQLGNAAVEAVMERRFGLLIGISNGVPAASALEFAAGKSKPADRRLLELATVLAN
jgi:6-phosphofructokinase 1